MLLSLDLFNCRIKGIMENVYLFNFVLPSALYVSLSLNVVVILLRLVSFFGKALLCELMFSCINPSNIVK